MQNVSGAFTTESRDSVRFPVQSTQVSWKKSYLSIIRLFTIGVSRIGGTDTIAGPDGIQSQWNNYQYDDESSRVMDLSYERSYNLPVGGVSKALADLTLDNTSGRYLPDYMGGHSAIFTAVLPRRPIIINTGFNYAGVDNTIPQFVGVLRRQPQINARDRQTSLSAVDFIDYLANKTVDNTQMFTGQRSDILMEEFLTNLGFSTAQFTLDEGRQTIDFLLLEKGQTYIDIMNKIIEAEGGQLYQNESGRIVFENRVHWDTPPHNMSVAHVYTGEVIENVIPDEDQIINVVEINAKPRVKKPAEIIFTLGGAIEIGAGLDHELFINFDNPILAITDFTLVGNTESDNSGSDVSGNIIVKSTDLFAQAVKYVFSNTSAATAFITTIIIYGRPAKIQEEVYQRSQADASVTAYEERKHSIENDLIQSQSQAESLAETLLSDYSQPNKLQEITILAKPQLQMGDFIDWQGRSWLIWGIKTRFDASYGFVQTLKILQRNILSYFTIGVSRIGGGDVIAP